MPDGSSQYLLLAVFFPSLAFISRPERAGNFGIEPKGADTGSKDVENKIYVGEQVESRE